MRYVTTFNNNNILWESTFNWNKNEDIHFHVSMLINPLVLWWHHSRPVTCDWVSKYPLIDDHRHLKWRDDVTSYLSGRWNEQNEIGSGQQEIGRTREFFLNLFCKQITTEFSKFLTGFTGTLCERAQSINFSLVWLILSRWSFLQQPHVHLYFLEVLG